MGSINVYKVNATEDKHGRHHCLPSMFTIQPCRYGMIIHIVNKEKTDIASVNK